MDVNARAKDTVLAKTREYFSRTFLEAYPKSNRRYHTKNTCNTGRWRQDAEASVWHTDPFGFDALRRHSFGLQGKSCLPAMCGVC